MDLKKLTFVLLFFSIIGSTSAQEAKFKALFLVKFAQYIEWPDGNDKITIGVSGDTEVLNELKKFADKTINIETLFVKTPEQTQKCQILFVASSTGKAVTTLANSIGNNSTLVVSDSGMKVGQGADIGFFLEGDRLRFRFSQSGIESKKMVASSKLLALGHSI